MAENTDRKKQIGSIMTILRKQQGFSQEYVSRIISKGRSAYAYYESGKTMPGYDTLQKLARLYRVPISVFDENSNAVLNSTQADYNNEWESELSFNDLSAAEQELVLRFRIMTKEEKIKLLSELDK